MNKTLPLLFGLLCSHAALAQQNKPMPVFSNAPASTTPTLRMPAKPAVPAAANPFNAPTTTPKTLPALMPHAAPANAAIHVVLGENGLPIMMEGKTAASGSAADARPAADRALDYLASIAPQGLEAPAAEFVVKSVHADAQGNQHIRMEQYFQGAAN
jgi:hypothetical protein